MVYRQTTKIIPSSYRVYLESSRKALLVARGTSWRQKSLPWIETHCRQPKNSLQRMIVLAWQDLVYPHVIVMAGLNRMLGRTCVERQGKKT